MRDVAFVTVLLCCLTACAQGEGERRALEDLWDNGQVRVRGEQVKQGRDWVKDGDVHFYRRDGSTQAVGRYALGLEVGAWVEHLDDGSRAEGEYEAGKRSGLWTYYFEGGSKQEEGHFSAGERVGEWTWWYKTGERRSVSFYAAGKIHGQVQAWTAAGEIDVENSKTYEHGQVVGD